MTAWIIASALLGLSCAALGVGYVRARSALNRSAERENELEALRGQLHTARCECARRRREIASLQQALEVEQDWTGSLETELRMQAERMAELQSKARSADAKRIRTEKDVGAERMRANLLEKEMEEVRRERAVQEQLYQDIIRDRDAEILKLQERQKKRAGSHKKRDALERQVSLDDLLKASRA